MNEIVMQVTGMTCGSCVRHVTAALKAVQGVEDVTVDLASGRVAVRARAGTRAVNLISHCEAAYPARVVDGAEPSPSVLRVGHWLLLQLISNQCS